MPYGARRALARPDFTRDRRLQGGWRPPLDAPRTLSRSPSRAVKFARAVGAFTDELLGLQRAAKLPRAADAPGSTLDVQLWRKLQKIGELPEDKRRALLQSSTTSSQASPTAAQTAPDIDCNTASSSAGIGGFAVRRLASIFGGWWLRNRCI